MNKKVFLSLCKVQGLPDFTFKETPGNAVPFPAALLRDLAPEQCGQKTRGEGVARPGGFGGFYRAGFRPVKKPA
jgi:hypothetical protein